MKRSGGVTVIAVFVLLGSLLTLAVGLFTLAILLFIPVPGTVPFPGSSRGLQAFMVAMIALFYVGPAIWGISSSIGLLRLRNWARLSTIVFSVLLLAFAAFGILIAFMPLPLSPGRTESASVVSGMRIALSGFWGMLLAIAIWWLVFLNRAAVKAQFCAAPMLTDAGGNVDSLPLAVAAPQRPKPPLSFTVIAVFLFLGCAFLPFTLALHLPVVLFTKLLSGWAAAVYLVIYGVAGFLIAIGLLRLQPAARWAAIILFLFGTVNAGVFFLAPGGRSRTMALLAAQQSVYSWPSPLQSYQAGPVDMAPFVRLGALGGFLGTAIPLYFLFTRKRVFEEAAATRRTPIQT